jgi:cell division transport system permease protein
MLRFYRRAVQDIRSNRFINSVTVITIALSVLIVSSFALFLTNIAGLIDSWQHGVRVMAYLKSDVPEGEIAELSGKIRSMYGVAQVNFISSEEAFRRLKEQMHRQASLLTNLKENPLPDAFEIRMLPANQTGDKMERLASLLGSLPQVEDVEYGQQWIGRMTSIFSLFRIAGYALGGLFFMASVFIVANTIRLVLYTRRQEIEIMRLVGATDAFIKMPFYVEGLLLGGFGGITGLAGLSVMFLLISSNVEQSFTGGFFSIRFLPLWFSGATLLCSMLVGWLGCYLSLKQFMKI